MQNKNSQHRYFKFLILNKHSVSIEVSRETRDLGPFLPYRRPVVVVFKMHLCSRNKNKTTKKTFKRHSCKFSCMINGEKNRLGDHIFLHIFYSPAKDYSMLKYHKTMFFSTVPRFVDHYCRQYYHSQTCPGGSQQSNQR